MMRRCIVACQLLLLYLLYKGLQKKKKKKFARVGDGGVGSLKLHRLKEEQQVLVSDGEAALQRCRTLTHKQQQPLVDHKVWVGSGGNSGAKTVEEYACVCVRQEEYGGVQIFYFIFISKSANKSVGVFLQSLQSC